MFGVRLKELRIANNLTQEELGKQLNLSKANISKFENASIEPNIYTIKFLANFFGVTTDYLLGYVPNKSLYNSYESTRLKEKCVDKFEFGEYLRNLRGNASTRQVEIKTGISKSYISLIERGEREIPSPYILKKLASL